MTLSLVPVQQSDACTRAVYQGPDGTIITGRRWIGLKRLAPTSGPFRAA